MTYNEFRNLIKFKVDREGGVIKMLAFLPISACITTYPKYWENDDTRKLMEDQLCQKIWNTLYVDRRKEIAILLEEFARVSYPRDFEKWRAIQNKIFELARGL